MIKRCPTCHDKFTGRASYCNTTCANRAKKLKKRYGITPNEVYFMYKDQKGKCAICGIRGDVKELGYNDRVSLCVDHDHDTGAIRKLLCGPCNRGIGLLQDRVDVLASALKYLRKHKRIKHVRRRKVKQRRRTKG